MSILRIIAMKPFTVAKRTRRTPTADDKRTELVERHTLAAGDVYAEVHCANEAVAQHFENTYGGSALRVARPGVAPKITGPVRKVKPVAPAPAPEAAAVISDSATATPPAPEADLDALEIDLDDEPSDAEAQVQAENPAKKPKSTKKPRA